jgi:hypothetical protein
MRIGIDASGIRAGGGVTHLVNVLRAVRLEEHGLSGIVVWAGSRVAKDLPSTDGMDVRYVRDLDLSLPRRVLWQYSHLPKLAREECDLLFVPGGSLPRSGSPFVTMSQNLLPEISATAPLPSQSVQKLPRGRRGGLPQ